MTIGTRTLFNKLISLLALLYFFITPIQVAALSYPNNTVGQDISWPNCSLNGFRPASFGIVGVNGGLSNHPNNCLGAEASLYRQNLSLYVNTGFPGAPYDLKFQNYPKQCNSTSLKCLAYNYGYNSGKYATNYSLSRGVVSNNWWLDVETVNSWTNNYSTNIASLQGEIDGIKSSMNPSVIGFYTYPPEWQTLTNNWLNNYPNWVATNSNSKTVANEECNGKEFNSGKTLLTQYIGKYDLDLSCLKS